MAYAEKGLQVEYGRGTTGPGQSGANFFRRATYITPDAAAVVEAANYFDAAAVRLPKNTIIQALMVSGGTPVFKQYVVTANDGSTVTIALQTATAG